MAEKAIARHRGHWIHWAPLAPCRKGEKWDLSCLSLHPLKHQRYVTGVEYHHVDLLVLNELESLLSDREFDYVVNLGGYIDHTLFKQGDVNSLKNICCCSKSACSSLKRKA